MSALLDLKDVQKRFGAVQALSGVDLSVGAGEVLALLGDNGAGKSTLIKCVAGIHPLSGGEIWWQGERVDIRGPRDAAALGIEVVYQDLALADNLDVVENMFLGREHRAAFGTLDKLAMEQEALAVMERLRVTTVKSPRQPVASLSGGQRQSIAVAKAVLWKAKLVILDEPTAALGVAQTREVLNLVKNLREEGLGVILISHNLTDVLEVADRIVVLRLGRDVAHLDASRVTEAEVVHAITAGVAPQRQENSR